ncbi:MAG: hypothetical protein WBG15_18765, partial [Xanthobacteraceae bacterium]
RLLGQRRNGECRSNEQQTGKPPSSVHAHMPRGGRPGAFISNFVILIQFVRKRNEIAGRSDGSLRGGDSRRQAVHDAGVTEA